jgi:hypothetical protein
MYFSLHVWVRGNDGSLKRGDLSPGVSARVSTLPVAAQQHRALRVGSRTSLHSGTTVQ